jgi:CxxC motif-containing protein (DUF1111 family)
MKKSHLYGYAILTLAVAVPLGIRAVTRPTPPQQTPLDPALVQAGQVLFNHDWVPNDPLCAAGDGLGPVYNATSCVACHKQGGVGGSGGLEHNVTVFVAGAQRMRGHFGNETPRQGVVHAHAVKFQETLKDVDPGFPAISQPPLALLLPSRCGGRGRDEQFEMALFRVQLSQRNTPALFGAKLIDEIPDSVIIANERSQRLAALGAPPDSEERPIGRALRLPDGRVGHFGWKAQSASLSDFVRAACAGELGLSNPGQDQPRPLTKPDYQVAGFDLTAQQCDQITAFVAALPRPIERPWADAGQRHAAARGRNHFDAIGCADCHVPQVGSVAGIYSDLLMHRMGSDLEGSGSYNQQPDSPGSDSFPDEWRTPPLWGVADSGPWLHDGRAATLEQAIELHAGQAAGAAGRYRRLGQQEQGQLIAFLQSLRAP